MQYDHVLKKLNFNLLTPRALGGSAGEIVATLWLHLWFHLSWCATWPCFEKVNFDILAPPPGSGGGRRGLCGQNICYQVSAFVILFNLVCNLTMFWKSWILTFWLQGQRMGGERGSAGKIFATMLLHSCFPLMWYATCSCSEKVEFWRFDPTH